MTAIALQAVGTRLRSLALDPILLAIGAILIGLAVFLPGQFQATVSDAGASVLGILPILAFAVTLAGWVQASGVDSIIFKAFNRNTAVAILAACLIAVIDPFCSCGVIPLIAALMAAGIPLPTVMAFWLASPLMDPQTFLLLVGTVGVPFALVKVASAVLMGMFGGYTTLLLTRRGIFAEALRPELKLSARVAREKLAGAGLSFAIWRDPARWQLFTNHVFGFSFFLLKVVTLAFILESLMVAYIPSDIISEWLGRDSAWGVPIAVLVGVPAYMNGAAAIPLTAGLMQIGMSQSAALAFLTAGPVSSIPAALAVYSLTRKSIFFWYLALAYTGSLLVGWGYGAILTVLGLPGV